MCERNETLDAGIVPFQDRLDRAIPVVAYPPTHRVLLGECSHGVAKKDPMDDNSFPHRLSRLRTLPYRIEIDLRACVGFAECARTAPGVFALDEFVNQSMVVNATGADDDTVLRAAEACPMSAISLYDGTTGAKVFGED